jgi:general secretion pathway protein F/type IV pilus assembly protein PilC
MPRIDSGRGIVQTRHRRTATSRPMPLSHRKLAAWYGQLAQTLEAGVPLPAAVRMARGLGPTGVAVETMAQSIERTGSFDDALRSAGKWLPSSDQLFLSAAAEAGRLPPTLRKLAARHAQMGASQLRLALALLYPAVVLHIGLLLLPVVRMIDWEKGFAWSAGTYVQSVAVLLLPLWGVAALSWLESRRENSLLGHVARRLPFLGRYVRAQRISDLAFALGSFLEAGVAIGQAWAAAGLIVRSRELDAATRDAQAAIARGEPPGERLGAHRCIPQDFVGLYRAGEASGHLDENLHRLAVQYQEQANRALGLATLFYPGLVFLAVAGAIVFQVVSFYAGYLRMLGRLGEP